MQVGFIGLGTMGYPMAGHLQQAGHNVRVFNRTPSKASQWHQVYGGTVSTTPREAATDADIVFCCVGDDNDIRDVCIGEQGVLKSLKPGAILVDHTTTSAKVARELDAQCQQQGCAFIDAPVSGGEQGAINGALTVMCGGDSEAFKRITPVISCYAQESILMGPAGSGQLTKMVNQICVAGVLQGLAEGLHFAEKAGLDRQRVIDVIAKGAAQSWQMENRHKTMIAGQYEHGFAVDWMRKDLKICLEEANRNGSVLKQSATIDQYYGDVQQLGGGRYDTSSLLLRLQSLKD